MQAPNRAACLRLSFGLTWLIILPAGLWGILDYYLPLLGGTLSRTGTWTVTAGILLSGGGLAGLPRPGALGGGPAGRGNSCPRT